MAIISAPSGAYKHKGTRIIKHLSIVLLSPVLSPLGWVMMKGKKKKKKQNCRVGQLVDSIAGVCK